MSFTNLGSKLLSGFYGTFEYIAKHNWAGFISIWFCISGILFASGRLITQWQYYFIWFTSIFLMLVMYAKGRIDEEKSTGDILEQMKPEIKKQLYNAVAESMLAKTGRIPRIEITEVEKN